MDNQREFSRDKRARFRGTFTPSNASGYNRKQRFALAIQATREGKAELLDAGCDLLEARKEAVNPQRVSVARQLKEVWKNRAALKRIAMEQKRNRAIAELASNGSQFTAGILCDVETAARIIDTGNSELEATEEG